MDRLLAEDPEAAANFAAHLEHNPRFQQLLREQSDQAKGESRK
jgi:hypothetical protein